MPGTQFLLDTSAFHRLELAELRGLGLHAKLLVSPLTVYQILCHLDAPLRADEPVEKTVPVHQSRLVKCGLLRLLEDPFAEHDLLDGGGALLSQTRYEDRQLLPQLFQLMTQAATLEDFFQATVSHPGGDREPVRQLASRARAVIDEAEREHVAHSRSLCEGLLARFGLARALALSPTEFVKVASEEVPGLSKRCAELGVRHAALAGEMFSSLYPYAGYRLARAQDHLKATGGNGAIALPANDMEDAYLCLHLNLLQPTVLVTADTATRAALDRALADLAIAAKDLGAEIVARTRVMSPEELLRAFPERGVAKARC